MRWLRSESPSKRVFGQVNTRDSIEGGAVMVVNKELDQLVLESHSGPTDPDPEPGFKLDEVAPDVARHGQT